MHKHYHFHELESTQTYCLEHLDKLSDYDYVTCSVQTKGYGRSGMWDGLEENLYYSQIIPKVKSPGMLSVCISIAIHELVSEFTNCHYLKLPNDIYIGKQKLAGYIFELSDKGYVIGIGLNVMEPENNERVGLVKYQASIDIKELAKALNKHILSALNVEDELLVLRFKQISMIIGKQCKFIDRKTNVSFTKKVIDLDEKYYYFKDDKFAIEQLKLLI